MEANSVSRICAAPVFQDAAARMRRELELATVAQASERQVSLREQVVTAGSKAVSTLDDLMGSGSEVIKLSAAREVLKTAFALEGSGSVRPGGSLTQVNILALQSALESSRADQRALPPTDVIDAELVPAEDAA